MPLQPEPPATAHPTCAGELEVIAVPGLPRVQPGDDLTLLLGDALAAHARGVRACDVLVVTSKIVSRATGRFVDLSTVTTTGWAEEIAQATEKDPRLVELVLRESSEISRQAPGVLIVRHRLGFVSANAGIDASNAVPANAPPGSGPWVLLLPEKPDAAARELRLALEARFGVPLGVILSDSHGRPFRNGTVGMALGVSGVPALVDQRGTRDLDGRALEHTETALADQLAAAADLVAGQAAEGRPLVVVRGLEFSTRESSTHELLRPPDRDLYR